MGLFLILLSLCTYPIVLRVALDQQAVWQGQYATDIFMAFRATIVCGWAFGTIPFIKKPYLPYLLYLFILAMAVVSSKSESTSLFGTPNYYEGFFVICAYLVMAMYGEFPERGAKWSVYIVGLAGIVQFFHGCYFNLSPIHFLMPKNVSFDCTISSIYSTFGNSNHLGLFCAVLFPFFLARRKILPTSILLFLLIASQCRGAWVSVIITTLIQFRNKWKTVVVVTALCLVPVYPRVLDGFKSLHWPIRDSDMDSRAFIWSQTVPMLKHHWLIGSGPGAYALDFPQHSRGMFANQIVDRPHNIYLNMWYSTGFLSLLIWAWILAEFFWDCWDVALSMGVLGFLIAGFFTDSVVSVTPYFMLMLGAGLRCGSQKREYLKNFQSLGLYPWGGRNLTNGQLELSRPH